MNIFFFFKFDCLLMLDIANNPKYLLLWLFHSLEMLVCSLLGGQEVGKGRGLRYCRTRNLLEGKGGGGGGGVKGGQ